MEITRCLTISTAHITKETERVLSGNSYTNELCLSVYDKADYGWWICIDDDDIDPDTIPADLLACIRLAHANKCEWLCLDCDGEVLDVLPTYDW